jgi:hypothetical protein
LAVGSGQFAFSGPDVIPVKVMKYWPILKLLGKRNHVYLLGQWTKLRIHCLDIVLFGKQTQNKSGSFIGVILSHNSEDICI